MASIHARQLKRVGQVEVGPHSASVTFQDSDDAYLFVYDTNLHGLAAMLEEAADAVHAAIERTAPKPNPFPEPAGIQAVVRSEPLTDWSTEMTEALR